MHLQNGSLPAIATTKKPVNIEIPAYGACIAESHHEAGFKMPSCSHPYLKIYFITEGVGDLYLGDGQIKLATGNVVVIPANATHSLIDRAKSPLSLYILAVQDSCLENLSTFTSALSELNAIASTHGRPLLSHDYMAYEIPRLFKRILYEQHFRRPGYIPAIQATLLNLIVSLNRIYQNIPVAREVEGANGTVTRIQQVARYITTNFYEPITVESMARMACLSVRQFTNQFKATHGVTFMQFLHYYRVRFAQQLLVQTDKQITSICFESGFNDLAHFYRVFKKIAGMSPRKYRLNGVLDPSERLPRDVLS